jgi:hypothetical protein
MLVYTQTIIFTFNFTKKVKSSEDALRLILDFALVFVDIGSNVGNRRTNHIQ